MTDIIVSYKPIGPFSSGVIDLFGCPALCAPAGRVKRLAARSAGRPRKLAG